MSQIVQSFNEEPDKFKEWVKFIEKYATLTRLGNVDIPRIVYQACTGPVGDFIRRYLNVKEEAGEDPSWFVLKENLTTRFAEINYQHQAFAVLRKTKQKPNESVQLFAERLLNNAEDAYPQAGDRPVVEQQMINVLLDGLYHDYLKMKVLREDPRTFNEALQIAMREQNIRKHFALGQDNEPRQNRYKPKENNKSHSQDETPMEVDHFRPKRCYKCKRQGHLARDCRVRTANEIQNLSRQGFGSPRQVSNSNKF